MGYVKVKFLEEVYQVSEAINEFLRYDSLLVPFLEKITKQVASNLARDSKYRPSDICYNIWPDTEKYKNILLDSTDFLVKQMLNLGIYDVTANDLLEGINTFSELDQLEIGIKRKIIDEGEKYLDMRKQGIEKSYSYARRHITGSGIGIFTNSFSSLMAYTLTERSIVLSQAKKADKEYQKAVEEISVRVDSGFEQMCKDVIFGEYYPMLVDMLIKFPTEIMSHFMKEVISHNKLDFQSIKQYDLQKASEMLKNIYQVSDKADFLKQTFLVCPFSFDLYEKCLEFNLLDEDTFKTAAYFGMGEALSQKIINLIKCNLKDVKTISPLIKILVSYQNTNEVELWKQIYSKILTNIEDTYKAYNLAISNKKSLDKFIRANIVQQMTDILNKSREDIFDIVISKLKNLIDEEQYVKFVELGIISPDKIRMTGSCKNTLDEINDEISIALVNCIMDYSAEAKKRWECFNQAKKLVDAEIDKKNRELNDLIDKKRNLGFLAFSKKKDLTDKISCKKSEISEYQKTHDTKPLFDEFNNMYR